MRRAKDRRRFSVQAPPGGTIYVQTAYDQKAPEAEEVVGWLAEERAAKRFAALGLAGPGPDPTFGVTQKP